MHKRVIALIGAFVMIFALALPCFAETEDYDTTVTFLPEDLINRPACVGMTVIDISGEVEIHVVYSSSSEKTYTIPALRVYFERYSYSLYGNFYGIVVSNSGAPSVVFCINGITDGVASLSCAKTSLSSSLVAGVTSLTISYNLADVFSFNAALCDEYGFAHPETFSESDLENARQEGYDEGYQVAGVDVSQIYKNGYDEGYGDAMSELDNLTYGLFSTAKFTAIVKGADPSSGASYTYSLEFVPNFVYSGVFFSSLFDQIDTYLGSTFGDNVTGWEYVDRVEIQMEWTEEHVFDYQALSLFISGDMDINYGQIYTTSGKSYAINAIAGTSGNLREFVVDSTSVDPIIVNKIVIRVGRPADLLTAFSLYSPDESYNEGYTEGYAVGYGEGESAGWLKGMNAGYDNGFDDGKEEGLLISDSGDWRNLMLSVVEVPVNTIQSLFNFEILGLDMRIAFGSILAVCVLLIIVKKVLL